MNGRLETVLSVSLTIAAVAIAAVLVRREFFGANTGPAGGPGISSPVREPDWEQIRTSAVAVGDSTAPIEIVEFVDFECSACRTFHRRLQEVRRKMPGVISLRVLHFPLAIHRFARSSAQAADCAASQGRLPAMYDLLFEKQDSLGLKDWSSFAHESGIADTALFKRCVRSTAPVPAIMRGRRLGEELKIPGTPTVFIGGWRFMNPPDEKELQRVVANLRSGRLPY